MQAPVPQGCSSRGMEMLQILSMLSRSTPKMKSEPAA